MMYVTFTNNEQYLDPRQSKSGVYRYPNLSMLVETVGVTRLGEVDASEEDKQFMT